MKIKLSIVWGIALSGFLITSTVLAGSNNCSSMKIRQCIDSIYVTPIHFYTYNGNDAVHSSDFEHTNFVSKGTTWETYCNYKNCDIKILAGDGTYWKNDHCGDITIDYRLGVKIDAGLQTCR